MCSVVGALLRSLNFGNAEEVNRILAHIWLSSHARGRDGRGYAMHFERDPLLYFDKSVKRYEPAVHGMFEGIDVVPQVPTRGILGGAIVGNLRAEPTTEYVMHKREDDQQPYSLKGWSIVHNGTIANDKELRTGALPTTIDSAAIVELLGPGRAWFPGFVEAVRKLRGSFAILGVHSTTPSEMYVAVNYRPVWYIDTPHGYFFASSRDNFPYGYVPQMIEPYTISRFSSRQPPLTIQLHPDETGNKKALVVCSGGLDSVVSAAWAQKNGYDVTLVHFRYGSRAEGPEVDAIQNVSAALGVPYFIQPIGLYRPGDSPLLDKNSKIAGGEAGAEFAHEWVPARNLLMLAMATALAEARGMQTIVLGNNLEEAGAYPDNEPEFIARFNDVLPFAVGDGKRVRVIMPVGNMMKHEIVALGHKLDAPMHLTWSCYRAGVLHCGTCGPCYMRRKAFEINDLDEVIDYEKD